MWVAFRYLKVILAFICAAENDLHRKHYDHVLLAKSKVKQVFTMAKQGDKDGYKWMKDGYNWIKNEYNWIKDE